MNGRKRRENKITQTSLYFVSEFESHERARDLSYSNESVQQNVLRTRACITFLGLCARTAITFYCNLKGLWVAEHTKPHNVQLSGFACFSGMIVYRNGRIFFFSVLKKMYAHRNQFLSIIFF